MRGKGLWALHGAAVLALTVMAGSALRSAGQDDFPLRPRGRSARGGLGPAAPPVPQVPENGTARPDRSSRPNCGLPAAMHNGPSGTDRVNRPSGSFLLKATDDCHLWVVDPSEVAELAFADIMLSPIKDGVRIARIGDTPRPGLLSGMEEGDIVRAVNGIPVRTESELRRLFGKCWEKSPVVRTTLERRGRLVVVAYKRLTGSSRHSATARD